MPLLLACDAAGLSEPSKGLVRSSMRSVFGFIITGDSNAWMSTSKLSHRATNIYATVAVTVAEGVTVRVAERVRKGYRCTML